jgi:hypothetical protein
MTRRPPPLAGCLLLAATRKGRRTCPPVLRPYPADAMRAFPVSELVNDPKNDGPECLEPPTRPRIAEARC